MGGAFSYASAGDTVYAEPACLSLKHASKQPGQSSWRPGTAGSQRLSAPDARPRNPWTSGLVVQRATQFRPGRRAGSAFRPRGSHWTTACRFGGGSERHRSGRSRSAEKPSDFWTIGGEGGRGSAAWELRGRRNCPSTTSGPPNERCRPRRPRSPAGPARCFPMSCRRPAARPARSFFGGHSSSDLRTRSEHIHPISPNGS